MTYPLAPVQVTAPATLPVTLAEAKAHLRLDHFDDDATVQIYIGAATSHLDGWSGILGRALVTQTWRFDFAGWGDDGVLRLGLGPLQAVTSVTYTDEAGAVQTLPGTSYDVFTDALGPAVALKATATWPVLADIPAPVRVTATVGHGDAAAVPGAIKAAILLMVADLYENREAQVAGTIMTDNATVARLLAPFRRGGLT